MYSVQIFLLTIVTMHASANAMDKITVLGVKVQVPENCLKLMKTEKDKNIHSYAHYCVDEPSDYPSKQVEKLLNDTDIDFNTEDIPEEEPYRPDLCKGERNKNCCSSSTTITPFFILSESKLKLVLHTSYFTQRLKTTQCRNEGILCFKDFYIHEPSTLMKPSCKTNKSSTKVYVFNPETNKTETVPVEFPVSCSCHVNKKKTYIG